MANSSLVPNTKLLGHTNIQKAKFERRPKWLSVFVYITIELLREKKNLVWPGSRNSLW